MGVLLIVYAMAGVVCGALLSSAALGVATVLTHRMKESRENVWRRFWLGMALGTVLGAVCAASIGAPDTRPGSDYDLIARYWLVTAAAYAAAPGLGAVAGLALVLAGRRRPAA